MYLFFSMETEVMFSQLHTQNHSTLHTVKWPWLVPQRSSALTRRDYRYFLFHSAPPDTDFLRSFTLCTMEFNMQPGSSIHIYFSICFQRAFAQKALLRSKGITSSWSLCCTSCPKFRSATWPLSVVLLNTSALRFSLWWRHKI